jgi:diadenylate cyclase
MAESIIRLTLQLQYLFTHLTIGNIIDMSLVTVVFFIAFQALYQTRALQLLRGVIIAAILGGGLLVILPLNTLNWLIRFSLLAGAIALPILFQDELRRVLVGLGQIGGRRGAISDFERYKQSLISSISHLADRHIGALIVLEGQTLIEDVIETGVRMEAEVLSPELIQTIFSPKTALHDGAVVLRGDHLLAASCILPVQTENLGDAQLGTRHRAALGLSVKVSDALIIIVSEETGWISVAFAGRLYLDLSLADLDGWINRFGAQLEDRRRTRWSWLAGGGVRPTLTNLMISIFLAVIAWLIVVYQTNPPGQIALQGVPLFVQTPPADLLVINSPPQTVNVQIQTTKDRIDTITESSVRAVLDLSNLSAGVHSVPVLVSTADPFLQAVAVKPNAIDVTLEPVLTKPITPTVRITDLSALAPGYVVGDVSMTPGVINVTGAQSTVEKISTAYVEIALQDRRADFQQTVTPVLFDSSGEQINGLKVQPEQVVATVPIRRTVFSREIGIQAVVDDSGLSRDYEVRRINISPSIVTLTGPQNDLQNLGSFIPTAPISLTNKTEDFTIDAPLILPNGITALNDQGEVTQSAEVTITITPVTGYLVLQKEIEISNPSVGISTTISPAEVSVLLIGPKLLLDRIENDPSLVIVSVQLENLSPGQYNLPLDIQSPSELQTQAFPNEVQVKIIP